MIQVGKGSGEGESWDRMLLARARIRVTLSSSRTTIRSIRSTSRILPPLFVFHSHSIRSYFRMVPYIYNHYSAPT